MGSQTRTRSLAIFAQDPDVRLKNGAIVMACIEVPTEDLDPGPCGHRIKVVDYDSSTDTLYMPQPLQVIRGRDPYLDQLEAPDNVQLVEDRNFHAQNVYAIAMSVLGRFEGALGRRLHFSFDGHQLHIAPHAFADANAFYVEEDRVLCFGYFQDDKGRPIYACLAHDVVAHETTHALLDALKPRYQDPSSPDQSAFHEGFADVVALLSVFALEEIVMQLLSGGETGAALQQMLLKTQVLRPPAKGEVTKDSLEDSVLFGLAKQMGKALSRGRHDALRRSVTEDLSHWKNSPEYNEPHRRGEIIVAAVMRAFLRSWRRRMEQFGSKQKETISLRLVVEEGAKVADHLLNLAIRALDYAPPTDLQFADFVSALLTADATAVPDDSRYEYRATLREEFAAVGIFPAQGSDSQGYWQRFDRPDTLDYHAVHAEPLRNDREEMFRFIWDNRKRLDIDERAYTRVSSVRPAVRVAPDGFIVRETVADYMQILELSAGELKTFGVAKPHDVPDDTPIRLYGGGVLIFDEHGILEHHVNNRVLNAAKQTARLASLASAGYFRPGQNPQSFFARLHLLRAGLVEPTQDRDDYATGNAARAHHHADA